MEDFFHFCFSDDAVDFQGLFHSKCGDKGNTRFDLYAFFHSVP